MRLVPLSTRSAQIVDFKSCFPGYLGEMADSRAKAGEVQDESVILCSVQKKCSKNYDEGMFKVVRSQSEGAPNGHYLESLEQENTQL